jgi:Zn-dependent M28 family amino/carboxypeptidase
VRSSWSGEQVELAGEDAPRLQAAAWIQLDIARKLFAASGLDLDALYRSANTREFRPLPLPVRLKGRIASTVRRFESDNVLGVLPGTSSGPAQQVVAYTAHYDHLGIVPGPGDSIYNGAVDNGTGCGILLELARAYAEARVRPPHPMLFAAVTAEEKGLLGSRYLGEHLPFPADAFALDLNYDAILPIGDPQSLTVTGAERTSQFATVQALARRFGMTIEPDPQIGAGHYYRSDHFSFARVGVPAFSIGQGKDFAGHPPEWGAQQEQDYNANRYHRPSDEYSNAMDFSGNAKLARFGFELGWLTSGGPPVRWQPGDEFANIRHPAAAPH